MPDKININYVLSSHWDREWYQTFQNFRYQLVEMLDEILEGISSKKLKGPFYSDGQVCLLDDYLEIRKANKPLVEGALKNKMIVSGPWYVLPDEFLVSGESLVRNIRLGFQTVRQFGAEPSKAGFLCDIFGHNSQMPQIFSKFGINAAFIWRGIDCETLHKNWEGADGTVIPAYLFQDEGYGDFAHKVRKASEYRHQKIDYNSLKEYLTDYLESEAKKTNNQTMLIFDGVDHLYWDEETYNMIHTFFQESPDFQFNHVSLDDYMKSMPNQSSINKKVKGELRYPAIGDNSLNWTIPDVLSSRADLKQDNAVCENLLCSWAEPFSAMAKILLDQAYPDEYLDLAWKWLIRNHPHDSICGCSIDQVHEDMKFRFYQCEQIAERLTSEALKKLALSVEHEMDDDQIRVVVFNPNPFPLDEVTELKLQLPENWPFFQEFFGFEKIPGFKLLDTDDNLIEYQRISKKNNHTDFAPYKHKIPELLQSTEVRIAARLNIPSLGYKTLILKPAKQHEPVRHSSRHNIAHSGNCLENKFMKISVNSNGTLNLKDKQTDNEYRNILRFEDNADIGDGWYHGLALNDNICNSFGNQARISVISNGPEMAKIAIRYKLELPNEFDYQKMQRSENFEILEIKAVISLKADSDQFDIELEVDNNIKDHRLRICFPSDASTDTYFSDTPFDVVERKVGIDENFHKKIELETQTRPQQSWTAVCDGDRGLAVASTGIYETEVTDEPQKPIKLTLLRCTRKTVFTSGEPNGQLQKPLKFKFSVLPVAGKVNRKQLFDKASKLANGLKTVQVRKKDLLNFRSDTKLPAVFSFAELDNAVMTSFSIFKENPEIRMFNPDDIQVSSKLLLNESIYEKHKNIIKTDFDSHKVQELNPDLSSNSCHIPLEPKEIANITITDSLEKY